MTDAEWALLEPLLPDRTPRRGGRWNDHRQIVDGVLWRTRTGAPWRDVPASYGNWKSVYSRHRRWSGDGTWEKVLDQLRTGCDQGEGREWTVGIDSSVVRAHQHAAGARHAPPKDIPAERLTPLLPEPEPTIDPVESAADSAADDSVVSGAAADTGGWVELQEIGAGALARALAGAGDVVGAAGTAAEAE
jgi:transposase